MPPSLANSKPTLTLDGAKLVVEAAEQFAASSGLKVVIAILDSGGHLLCLHRMDGAPLGSVEVAQKKARTSILFNTPSKIFEDGLNSGVTSLLTLDVLPFEGGLPLTVQGYVAGAIGVSGSTAVQDGTVAQAGANALLKEDQ